MCYNLEVLILTPSQTAVLERFHRATLRSIQGLPERTSSAATYLLLGAIPVEAILHAWILQLVGQIIMARDTFLHYIAAGQLAVKDTSSRSWFIMTGKLKLTGTYMLQMNRAKFNANDVVPTCPLCWKTQHTS